MIAQISTAVSAGGVNIEHMVNKSRKDMPTRCWTSAPRAATK
jgi:hypothetical protein